MTFTTENILLLGSILLFTSIVASKTSSRFGVPALVIFMLVGMIAGSDGPGGIYFDDPSITQFMGVTALNFILFSGGLDTKMESIKPVIWRGLSLSTLGVLVTTSVVGLFTHFVIGFSLSEGLLLGAIVSSTDAAAVFSILRTKSVGLKGKLRPTLELESGSNDPMAYLLTIAFTKIAIGESYTIAGFLFFFVKQLVIGGLVGYYLGKFSVKLVNRINLNSEGLYPVLLLATMLFIYSFTDLIGGNGFLAVYITAVVLGNSSFVHKRSLIRFFDGQAWLMQIIMFLTLGLLVFPTEMISYTLPGILISLFLIFIARPLAVFISLLFTKIHVRNKLYISWVGLRGAVPIIFATYPLLAGLENAHVIFNLVFFITLSSVLLQGTTISLVARWLKLAVPNKLKKRTALEMELEEGSKTELAEFDIPNSSKADGKTILELNFPPSSSIVVIKRAGNYITPKGNTVLRGGDNLWIMAEDAKSLEIVKTILTDSKQV